MLNRIATSPNLDINNDGRSDLLVGATYADVVDGSLKIDAGHVFVIHGTPPQTGLPSKFGVLANRTITGSGDYVVDKATGQPATFVRPFSANADENWFRFTTLGDGLPGNYLSVSPYATDPYDIRSIAAKTFQVVNGQTVPIVPPVANTIAVGTPSLSTNPSRAGVLEFDLSSILRLREDAGATAAIDFDYTSLISTGNFSSVEAIKSAVLGNTLYFYSFHPFGGNTYQTDGTVSGTRPVSSTNIPYSTDFRVTNGHLYFVAQGNLWKIEGEGASPQLLATGFPSLSEVAEVGDNVFFTSNNVLYSLAPNGTPQTVTIKGNVISAPNHLTMFNLGAEADEANLFFFANDPATNRALFRFDAATQSVIEVMSGISNQYESNAVGGAAGSALYFTVMSGVEQRVLWRLTRSGSDVALSRVRLAEGGAAVADFSSLTDVGGTLFAIRGYAIRAIANAGIDAELVKDFNPGNIFATEFPGQLTAVDFGNGPRLVMSAAEIGARSLANELWISDGTMTGTQRIGDVDASATYNGHVMTPTNLTVVGGQLYFAGFQGASATNRELYRTNGTALGTVLVKEFMSGTAGGFANGGFIVGGSTTVFAMAERVESGFTQFGTFTNNNPTKDILEVDKNLGLLLTVETLFDEPVVRFDAQKHASIDDSQLQGIAQFTFTTLITDASGLKHIDLFSSANDAVREALRTGKTRMLIRVSSAATNVQLSIRQSLAESSYGSAPGGPGSTRLVVTPSPGVLVDIFSDNGEQLAASKPLVGMRNFDAGTYYVHVISSASTLPNPSYTIEIAAPPAGQTRPQYEDPDRDVLQGNDGNDVLAGNGDFDRLFGGAGKDLFITDVLLATTLSSVAQTLLAGPEVRDFSANEDYSLSNVVAADSVGSFKIAQLDPIIVLSDPVLRRKVAESLNIATTNFWTPLDTGHDPLLARDLRGSDLASLVELDLGYTPFNNLTGLEYAINLRSLNLSGTDPGDINALELTTSSSTVDAGAPLGPSRLEYLSFDFAYIDFLEPLASMHELKGLSMDGYNTSIGVDSFAKLADLKQLNFLSADGLSYVVPLEPLAGLTKLRTLSLTGSLVKDISPLAYLDKLEQVYLADNRLTRSDALAGQWFADDSHVPNGASVGTTFTQTGNWQRNIQSVAGVVNGDYRFHSPIGGQEAAAQWQFTGLQSGEYEVWVTWREFDDRASNASFAIEGTTAGAASETVTIDQRLAPEGVSFGGVTWQLLDTVSLLTNPTAAVNSGVLSVVLRDLLADPANGVIAADAVRLARKSQPRSLELLTLTKNPLGNDAIELVETVLVPAIEDAGGATPWNELQYDLNPNAPTITRTVPILIPEVQTSVITSVPGYMPSISNDVDGGGVTLSYANDSPPHNVNVGSRHFSGDDAVVLPDTLQKYSTSSVAFEFWFSTMNQNSQTILSAVAPNGSNLLRIGTQHLVGAANSTIRIQLGSIVTSVDSFRNLADGQPRHLYVALNNLGQASATASIYVDGNIVATPIVSSGVITLESVVLGQAQALVGGGYVASNAFIGTMDEVRIWSKPRSPSQITGDRSLRLTSYEPFLRADYTFDDVANSATALDNAKDSARPPNILGWWRGEGNGTDVVTGVVGQAMNGVTYSNGYDNTRRSFGFDGVDDLVNIPNHASQNPSGQITIEAWVYPTANKVALIAGKVNGFQLYTFSNNAVGLFLPGVTSLSTISTLPLNQWSHVAGVYQPFLGGNIAIYINGVQIASSSAPPGPITVSNNLLQIGGLSVAGIFTGAFFQGRIDEVGLYGQALSSAQIVDIYSNGLPHHGVYGDTSGGPGNSAQAPQFVPGLTNVLGSGLLVNSVNGSLRQLDGFSGLAKVYTTATDISSTAAGFGRTATAIQDVYVGKFTGIYGSKFEDVDGNGIRSASEPGVEGWRIFLDINGDSSDDLSTLTDRNGDYAFTNLPWSSSLYSVWEATDPAWQATGPMIYTDIAINASTHLAKYDFTNQHR
ncbi:MAG: LamG-like jellyroll fold domain-containing protein, partial [Pirellula sp.]